MNKDEIIKLITDISDEAKFDIHWDRIGTNDVFPEYMIEDFLKNLRALHESTYAILGYQITHIGCR